MRYYLPSYSFVLLFLPCAYFIFAGYGANIFSRQRIDVFKSRDFKFFIYPTEAIPECFDNLISQEKKSYDSGAKSWMDPLGSFSHFNAEWFLSEFLKYHPAATNSASSAMAYVIPSMWPHWGHKDNNIINTPLQNNCVEKVKNMVMNDFQFYNNKRGFDHFVIDFFGFGLSFVFPAAIPLVMDPISFRNGPTKNSSNAWVDLIRTRQEIVIPYWDQNPSYFGDLGSFCCKEYIGAYFGSTQQQPIRLQLFEELNRLNAVASPFKGNPPFMVGSPYNLTIAGDIMKKSIFCPITRGASLSTRRLQSAILAGCIPVIFNDFMPAPFEGILDYSKFTIWVPEKELNTTLKQLLSFDSVQLKKLQYNLAKARHHFLFDSSSILSAVQKGGPLDLIVQEIRIRSDVLASYTGMMKRVIS